MKKRTPHLSCQKGKHVIVTLRDGSRHIDKFIEKQSKGIKMKKLGFVAASEIRAFSIYRGQDTKSILT